MIVYALVVIAVRVVAGVRAAAVVAVAAPVLDRVSTRHRLRPIDSHPALYTMLYNNLVKNRYAEPVLNKTKQISKIRD